MSKSVVYEESPPMVEGIPVVDVDVLEPVQVVVMDEELSGGAATILPYLELEAPPDSPPSSLGSGMRAEEQLRSQQHLRRKRYHTYFATGTFLMLTGLAFLGTVTIYYTKLLPASSRSMSISSLRSLCSTKAVPISSPKSILWTPTTNVQVGDLRLVTMNSEIVVGFKGNTMMETHQVVSNTMDLQYLESVQSLALSDNNVLVVSIANQHVQVLTREGNMWQVLHEIPKMAKLMDSNGEHVVLWSGTDVHSFEDEGQLTHIVSIQSASALKLSRDGNHLFVATAENEIKVFRKERGRWHRNPSIMFQPSTNDKKEDGTSSNVRATLEEEQRKLQLSVSFDGTTAAVQTSSGELFLYAYMNRDWQQLGGGYDRDDVVQLVAVCDSGNRIAMATAEGRLWVLEKKVALNAVEVIAELTVAENDIRALYFENENQLQVVAGDQMLVFESQCYHERGSF